LRIGKVKVELAGYDRNSGRQTGIAAAWLDADDLKLLAHLVLNRLFTATANNRFERFGGSEKADGQLESRTISVEWDDGDGKFARYPYRLTIQNGPGQKTATGAVTPAGEPTARIQMRLPETDLMKVLLVARDYVLAYEFNQHNRLVAQKTRDLRARLEERDAQHAPALPAAPPQPTANDDELTATEALRPARPTNGASSYGSARPPVNSATSNGSGSVRPVPAREPEANLAALMPSNVTPMRRPQPTTAAEPTPLPGREVEPRRSATR
jgi:hypothetical protein